MPLLVLLAGCQQLLGLDDPLPGGLDGDGGVDSSGVPCVDPITFTADGMFTVPDSCPAFTVQAYGGGGAHRGGSGGVATKTLTEIPAGTAFAILIGKGGGCGNVPRATGGYMGGDSSGGAGAGLASGAMGGAGGSDSAGRGGNGGYGGGGGGESGEPTPGNGGGAATVMRTMTPGMDYVIGGGGGGGGGDSESEPGGTGGDACVGYAGAPGGNAPNALAKGGGGGGGGACMCLGGTCDAAPTPTGGAGGSSGTCGAAQNGSDGRLVITFP